MMLPVSSLVLQFGMGIGASQSLRPESERALPGYALDALDRERAETVAGIRMAPQSEQIPALEQALREKDDIIAAQYTEITGMRRRLEQAVAMLNDMAKDKAA